MNSIYFWWSIFSTLIAVGLLVWDIWQLASNRKENDLHKAQVKLWQHHASGLLHGIIAIIQEPFSSVNDIKNAAKISQANAYDLYTSLNEERLFSEKEIKEKQLQTEQEFKKARELADTGQIK